MSSLHDLLVWRSETIKDTLIAQQGNILVSHGFIEVHILARHLLFVALFESQVQALSIDAVVESVQVEILLLVEAVPVADHSRDISDELSLHREELRLALVEYPAVAVDDPDFLLGADVSLQRFVVVDGFQRAVWRGPGVELDFEGEVAWVLDALVQFASICCESEGEIEPVLDSKLLAGLEDVRFNKT